MIKLDKKQILFVAEKLGMHPDLDFLVGSHGLENIAGELVKAEFPQEIITADYPVKLPYNPTRFSSKDGRFEYEVTLRRIIYPNQVTGKDLSGFEKRLNKLVREDLRMFYSDGLITQIESSESLVNKIKSPKNEEPSFLFRAQFKDNLFNNSLPCTNPLFYEVTLPVLIIPGIDNDPDLLDFSKENAFYEKSHSAFGFIGNYKTRITREEYEKAIEPSRFLPDVESQTVGCGC